MRNGYEFMASKWSRTVLRTPGSTHIQWGGSGRATSPVIIDANVFTSVAQSHALWKNAPANQANRTENALKSRRHKLCLRIAKSIRLAGGLKIANAIDFNRWEFRSRTAGQRGRGRASGWVTANDTLMWQAVFRGVRHRGRQEGGMLRGDCRWQPADDFCTFFQTSSCSFLLHCCHKRAKNAKKKLLHPIPFFPETSIAFSPIFLSLCLFSRPSFLPFFPFCVLIPRARFQRLSSYR